MKKTVKFKLGSIEYRIPNVVESLRLASALGIDENGLDEGRNKIELLATFIESVESFIVGVDIKKGSKNISSWSEALYLPEIMEPCSTIMNDMLSALGGGDTEEKK